LPATIASRLLSRHSPHEIAEAIEVLVDVLDMLGGDAEAEDATDAEDDFAHSPLALRYAKPGPGCAIADADEGSWVEWHTVPSTLRRHGLPGSGLALHHEDAEEDDPAGQCDEDGINTDLGASKGSGAGCMISDQNCCTAGEDRICGGAAGGGGLWGSEQGPGCEDDAEIEQLPDDVPMLPAWSLDHNIFTDERTCLGRSNLMSSFQTNGAEVRSADTGRTLRTNAHTPREPGQPV
jgi:hypothetical protein